MASLTRWTLSLSELQEMVMEREAWRAVIHVSESSAEPLNDVCFPSAFHVVIIYSWTHSFLHQIITENLLNISILPCIEHRKVNKMHSHFHKDTVPKHYPLYFWRLNKKGTKLV